MTAANLIVSRDYVTMPSGLKVPLPTSEERREADRITKRQEELYDTICRLPNSEEGQGRMLSLQRKIVRLENRKHPLCKIWNVHLLPAPAPKGGIRL